MPGQFRRASLKARRSSRVRVVLWQSFSPTFFGGPRQARLGFGNSGSVGMAYCPPAAVKSLGVLPSARSVREPLLGTCGLIVGL
jgi:hypothetical protein